ncbi:SPFH domain-containing protein [Streptomyces zaomyceticus]|uniref:SPFH domain-containing protein n=1 Tax=Streptomyces zaomyceticus TaxID=68286 RepID=UPI0035D724FD
MPVRPVGSVSGTASGASAVPGAAPKGPAAAGRPEPSGGTTIPRVQPVAPAYPGTRQAAPAGSSGAPAAPGTAPSGTGKHARPAATPASSASPSAPKASTPAVTVRSGGPAPVPVAVAAPAASPGATPGSPPDRSARRGDTPDFGRIAGAGVGSVALPVAAVVRVARRKNVIGSETTGSIPVHLLFRDEPGTARRPAAGEDDGGPDTVAMAAPAIPAPSKVQAVPGAESPTNGTPKSTSGPAHAKGTVKAPAKTPVKTLDNGTGKASAKASAGASAKAAAAVSASRPAPTADPALVERPAPVLPGWVGVVGGALALAACAAVVWWAGAVPQEASRMLRLPERPYNGIHLGQWAMLALGVVLALFALGGLGRGRVGYAWVLTLFGDYRGTVRRTGLVWVSPLLLRRRVDVRLRHWRSEPLSAVDAKGTALDVVVLVVWRVRDTVRAALGVDGHEDYLREQVEAAMARVLSQLPADAFHEDAPTLRDAEAVGEALTRMLSAECTPVGVDVFSAQPTRIEYAPEVAAAMTRRRIAAIDAKHRDSVLTSVVDAVDDVVHRLTSRGLVELDDYERKALVKDLTVAFYTGRTGPVEGA